MEEGRMVSPSLLWSWQQGQDMSPETSFLGPPPQGLGSLPQLAVGEKVLPPHHTPSFPVT